jgi:hypothetical protein
MNKFLWVGAAILLVLCLRINASRSIDGSIECLDLGRKVIATGGCMTNRVWSVSVKLPWRKW